MEVRLSDMHTNIVTKIIGQYSCIHGTYIATINNNNSIAYSKFNFECKYYFLTMYFFHNEIIIIIKFFSTMKLSNSYIRASAITYILLSFK